MTSQPRPTFWAKRTPGSTLTLLLAFALLVLGIALAAAGAWGPAVLALVWAIPVAALARMLEIRP